MIDQLPQPLDAEPLQVVLYEHPAVHVAHDDAALIAVADRREISEGGPQGPEAAAVGVRGVFDLLHTRRAPAGLRQCRRLAKPGPDGELSPPMGHGIDRRRHSRALVAGARPTKRMTLGREEHEAAVGGIGWLGAVVSIEQFNYFGTQGHDPARRPHLAAAVVEQSAFMVDEVLGEVGQVGVVERAVETQANPQPFLGISLVPQGANLGGGVALELFDSRVAVLLPRCPGEVAAEGGHRADQSFLHAPREERPHVGDGSRERGRRLARKALGEAGEVVRLQFVKQLVRPGALAEGVDETNGVGAAVRAEILRLPVCDAMIQVSVVQRRRLSNAVAASLADDLRASVPVDRLTFLLPRIMNLCGRRVLPADPAGCAAIPPHVAADVDREIGEQLAAQVARHIEVREPLRRGLGFGHGAHCAFSLCASQSALESAGFLGIIGHMAKGLKIHVSAVRSRPCPLKQATSDGGNSAEPPYTPPTTEQLPCAPHSAPKGGPRRFTVSIGDRIYSDFIGERLLGQVVAMTEQLCIFSVLGTISLSRATRTSYEVGEHVAHGWEYIYALIDPPDGAVSQLTSRRTSNAVYRPTEDAPECIRSVPNLRPFRGDERECVYFLCLLGQLVYVGSTANLCDRISSHKDSKQFDAVFSIDIGIGESRQSLEKWYIDKLQPPYNITGVRGKRKRDAASVVSPEPAVPLKRFLKPAPFELPTPAREADRRMAR